MYFSCFSRAERYKRVHRAQRLGKTILKHPGPAMGPTPIPQTPFSLCISHLCTQRSLWPISQLPFTAKPVKQVVYTLVTWSVGTWTRGMRITWGLVRNTHPRPMNLKAAFSQDANKTRCPKLTPSFPGTPHPIFFLSTLTSLPTSPSTRLSPNEWLHPVTYE